MPNPDWPESVRNAVKAFAAWMEKEDVSQAPAARLLQISRAALCQTLSGKYSGDVQRIARAMATLLRREHARARSMRTPYVKTDIAEQVLEAITNAHAERAIVFVLGPTGIGKTTAAQHYAQEEPQAVYLEAGPSAAPLGFLRHIGSVLGVALSYQSYNMRIALTDALSGSDQLIIIDEADYLPESTLHHLRLIHDTARIGMVFIGTEAYLRMLWSRRSTTLDQFLGRVAYVVYPGQCAREDIERLAEPYGLDREALDILVDGACGQARRAALALYAVHRYGRGYSARFIRRAFRELMPVISTADKQNR